MTPSLSDVGSGTIVSAVVGLGSGDRAPPRCPSPPSSTTFRAAPRSNCLSGELRLRGEEKNSKIFKLDYVTTTTCTGRSGNVGLPWLRLRSRQRLRAVAAAMQRSPMLRRAGEELCCSESVVHAADASPVDRGLRVCVGRRCSACRAARRTVEVAQAYRQNGSKCVECCSKVRCRSPHIA
jgi:hypothetical protein